MNLTPNQKRYLRGIAHHLHPLVTLADKGPSDNVLKELEVALLAHELVKVRITAPDRETFALWLERLLEASAARLVQKIGHVATLYRRHPTEAKLSLPRG
jgi:RNA-binding protein